jgi:hypothetical protein
MIPSFFWAGSLRSESLVRHSSANLTGTIMIPRAKNARYHSRSECRVTYPLRESLDSAGQLQTIAANVLNRQFAASAPRSVFGPEPIV